MAKQRPESSPGPGDTDPAMIEELPAEIKQRLESFSQGREEVRLAFHTDLTVEGIFDCEWIVLTDSRIVCIPAGSRSSDPRSIPLDAIRSISIRELGSNQILRIQSSAGGTDFARGTSTVLPRFRRLQTELDQALKAKNGTEESFIKGGEGRGRRHGHGEVRRCPKCGRPVPHGAGICPNCLDQRRLIARLLGLVKPYWFWMAMGFVLLGTSTFIGLTPPLLSRSLIDDVLIPGVGRDASGPATNLISQVLTRFATRGSIGLLGMIVMLMLIVNVLRSVLGALREYIITWLGQRIVVDLRGRVYEHLHTLSLGFFSRESTGQLMSRVTGDVNRLQSFLSSGLQQMGNDLFTLIMIVAILFGLSWRLAVLVVLPAPLLIAATLFFRNKLRRIYSVLWKRHAELSAILADTLPGIRVVKAFTQEKKEIDRFNSQNQQVFAGEMESLKVRTAYSPIMQFLTYLGTLFIWWVGGKQVLQGDLTIGTLMAFTGYMWQFYGPVQALCRMNHEFQRVSTSADRVFEILDTQPEVADAFDAKPIPMIRGSVEFRNVSFSYDKGVEALKDVSFKVEPGELIGLAGHSGAGKSTLINLICRFYDPDQGSILIDGHDLRDVTTRSLRSQIGVVLQDSFLFQGTVADNIAYGKPGATMREIIAAAKAANAHEFIMAFPEGYETLVGERGVRVSGGERQRISIARAILKDPRILILDEATASVDTETEALIQEALDRLVKGRTTFAIAHRLSTLRNADRLFILERGTIAEVGTHEELLMRNGIYARLCAMQRDLASLRAV